MLTKKTRFCLVILLVVFTFQFTDAQNESQNHKLKENANESGKDSYNSSIELCRYYWNHSFDSSVIYGLKALEISKTLNSDSLIAEAEICLGLTYNYIDQLDSTVYFCNSAIEKSVEYPLLAAKARITLSIAYRKLGDFNKSLEVGNLSLSAFEAADDSLKYAMTLGNISTTYQEFGYFTKAIEHSLDAARIFKSLNDSINLARRYGTIANIYNDLGDWDKGIYYYNEGINLVDSSRSMRLYILFIFNIATTYHNLEKYDSAIINYNIALHHYIKVNDVEGIAIANENIGMALLEKGEFRDAIDYLLTAYQKFSKLSTVRNISYVLSDLGMAYYRANKPDSAVHYLNMAVDSARKYKILKEEKKAEETLYKVYKSEKKYAMSLRSFERCSALSDSISSIGIQKKIAELNSKYQTEIKDQKIQQLLLDEKINQAKTRMYIISLLLFSVIVILVAIFVYSKKRTQTRLLTIKGKLLEKEKTELDKELEYKRKQLTSHALHMTQKNKILQDIRKAVNKVLPGIPEDTRAQIRVLQQELNKSLRYDKDWEVFSMYFNELNKDFFDKLTSINPDLSQYDLRLAALLRMNMNIKEAAAVLNIEPDSVKTARYKLRKKLGLKAEDDLVRFIMNIG